METVMQCSAYYRDREGRRVGKWVEGHEKGIEMYRMGLMEGTKGCVCGGGVLGGSPKCQKMSVKY